MTWKLPWTRNGHVDELRRTSHRQDGVTKTAALGSVTSNDDPLLRLYDETQRRQKRRLAVAAAALLVVLSALTGGFYLAKDRATTATVQRDAASSKATSLAVQIQQACAAGELSGPICGEAAQVVAEPVAGPPGNDGRGIASTRLENGRLVIAYTDGTSVDVGQVSGASGRGIASTVVSAGRLLVVYTDGTQTDVGQVVGAPGAQGVTGRGVTAVAASQGRLIVTYSDGTTADAGPLPPGPPGSDGARGADSTVPGPPGPAGADGQPPAGWTYTDSLGVERSCTRDVDSPDSAPTYACS